MRANLGQIFCNRTTPFRARPLTGCPIARVERLVEDVVRTAAQPDDVWLAGVDLVAVVENSAAVGRPCHLIRPLNAVVIFRHGEIGRNDDL